LEDTTLDLNRESFVSMNNPLHAEIPACLIEVAGRIGIKGLIRDFSLFGRVQELKERGHGERLDFGLADYRSLSEALPSPDRVAGVALQLRTHVEEQAAGTHRGRSAPPPDRKERCDCGPCQRSI
jgi:hypothetical protein